MACAHGLCDNGDIVAFSERSWFHVRFKRTNRSIRPCAHGMRVQNSKQNGVRRLKIERKNMFDFSKLRSLQGPINFRQPLIQRPNAFMRTHGIPAELHAR